MDFNYLTTIIFLPALGAVIIAFIPGLSGRVIRWLSVIFTLVPLALSVYLFAIFDRSSGAIQFEEKLSWIPAINAHYHLGVTASTSPGCCCWKPVFWASSARWTCSCSSSSGR